MHATVGDERQAMRALDDSAAALGGEMPETSWKGIGAFTPAKLTAYRGGALMRLRRYGPAQSALLEALGQLDPVQVKHRCTAHIDLADAYALDGRPDQAAGFGDPLRSRRQPDAARLRFGRAVRRHRVHRVPSWPGLN